MKILSFDIGIKNLAYCYTDYESIDNYNIIDWNVISLVNTHNCYFDKCDKDVKYTINNIFSCKKHVCKHTEYKYNTYSDYSINKLKTLQNEVLTTLCRDNNIEVSKYRTHNIKNIHQFLKDSCFHTYNKPSSKQTNSIEIAENINKYFNELFTHKKIDMILIENQIGPLASKMKSIQSMVLQYFVIKFPDAKKVNVSAINKLKDVTKKMTYKERKKQSIENVKNELEKRTSSWINFFNSSKKKDDLADSLLQLLFYMRLT
jgi:hypothetical protein